MEVGGESESAASNTCDFHSPGKAWWAVFTVNSSAHSNVSCPPGPKPNRHSLEAAFHGNLLYIGLLCVVLFHIVWKLHVCMCVLMLSTVTNSHHLTEQGQQP